MVEIQNKQIIDDISEKTKISNIAMLPLNLSNNIQPVMEIGKNIEELIGIGSSSAVTGGFAIHTADSTKDTYITSASLSVVKDGACDVSSGSINVSCTIRGATRTILTLAVLTLTASSQQISISFPEPIKIDKSSVVSITGAFTLGAMVRAGTITGYTVDTLTK